MPIFLAGKRTKQETIFVWCENGHLWLLQQQQQQQQQQILLFEESINNESFFKIYHFKILQGLCTSYLQNLLSWMTKLQ